MWNWQAGENFHLPGPPAGTPEWGTGGLTKTEGWDLHVPELAGLARGGPWTIPRGRQGIKRD